ncbi:MAG: PIG-L family deacetylase [Colwellia sp.]|nr:PIG-L family deacetylase [Colwellia sp.]
MAKILVVVAHADDEVLGCGATLAKHAEQGDDITLLVMTDGVSSRLSMHSLSADTASTNKTQRKTALEQSCDVLGINRLIQCDFPDNKMDSVNLLTIVQKIEEMTSDITAEIIYTHSQYDLNIDHRLTVQAVLTAFRPLPDNSVQTILSFEVPSSTEWQFNSEQFSANWFVDVSGTYAKKKLALACYQEEIRLFPHPRSFEAIEALAKLRGATIGKNYAEAFQLVRHCL